MRKRILRGALAAAVLVAAAFSSGLVIAETRLFVPRFEFSDSEDIQFLIANESDRDATVEFWAFTSAGELLGQFQTPVKGHGTRVVMLSEALELKGKAVAGWIGAVSREEGIQLSYNRIGEKTESFEAQTWTSREMRLSVTEAGQTVVRFSNPNPVSANLTISGTDQAGQFAGIQELTVGPFGQVEVPAANLLRGQASQLRITSNADVITALDKPASRKVAPSARLEEREYGCFALVIDSEERIGAYQVTLTFDPHVVQFSSKDVEGGASVGFDSKPLVVHIDNTAGQLTIGSFQVGAQPSGRTAVARLRAARSARFSMRVEEITDTAGNSLPRASVGIVRIQ